MKKSRRAGFRELAAGVVICAAALAALFAIGLSAKGNDGLFFACPQMNEGVSV
ncbi:MAG: hypothetical protein LBT26_06280 [Clostridiales Family XIII bacterium]|nr:hypothetical protein [Clostridiales Family XIII bacterium]